MTALIIDDELRGIGSLKKLLELSCPQVEVVGACQSEEEARYSINLLKPELIFLDIAMPDKSGIDLLNEIENPQFEVIFVTAHNNYMEQAFRFSAIDYLLKPVDRTLLAGAVQRAQKRIESKTTNLPVKTLLNNIEHLSESKKIKLCIPSLKGFQVVNISDILYCEAETNYTNFYFDKEPSICASKPIYEYEQMLEDSNFIRVHKSFLVNMEHVKEYIRGEGGTIVLNNGREIEVSRRKKEALMAKIKEFFKF